jgi:hypothetical protein
MENDLLDDDLLGQDNRLSNPLYLIIVALLNVVLTCLAYSGHKTESMGVLESEGTLVLIQASYWVLLMLLVDIIKAFKKAINEQELLQWGVNAFLWFLVSFVVIFFVAMLLFIPRIIFIVIVFMITSVSQVNFESIVLSTPYILFTIIFITGILYYYNYNQQTES